VRRKGLLGSKKKSRERPFFVGNSYKNSNRSAEVRRGTSGGKSKNGEMVLTKSANMPFSKGSSEDSGKETGGGEIQKSQGKHDIVGGPLNNFTFETYTRLNRAKRTFRKMPIKRTPPNESPRKERKAK